MIKGIYLTTIVLLSVCTTSGYNIEDHINYWKSGCVKIKKNDKSCSLKIYTDTTKQRLEYQIDGYSKRELATQSGENLYASLNVMSELSELAWSLSQKGKTPENIIDSLLKNKTSFSAAQKNGIGLLCLMVEYFNQIFDLMKTCEEDDLFVYVKELKNLLDYNCNNGMRVICLSLNNTTNEENKGYLNLRHDLEFYWNIFGGSYWCTSKFADEMKNSKNNFEKVASMRIKRIHFTECIQDSFFLREAISLAKDKKTFSTEIKKQVISIKEA